MKFLVDARALGGDVSGIERYVSGLLAGLVEAGAAEDVGAIVRDPDDLGPLAHRGIEAVTATSRAWSLGAQLDIPRLLARTSARVVHHPYVTAALRSGSARRVITVHDVIPTVAPELIRGSRKGRWRWVWEAWCRLQYATSAAIVTVSEHSRDEILRVTRLPPSKVVRIYNGVDAARSPPPDDAMGRFDLRGAVVSYFGRHDPYKNLARLVRAFCDLVARREIGEATLAIGGRRDPRYPEAERLARELPGGDRVRFLDYLTEDERTGLLARSSAFVFPSLHEGFGLPPLEAMAAGVPVVAADRTSLPEILGDAALLVDPTSTSELAAGIRRVLTDRELAARLRERGAARVARFTWRASAEAHLRLWERVAAVDLAQEDAKRPPRATPGHGAGRP